MKITSIIKKRPWLSLVGVLLSTSALLIPFFALAAETDVDTSTQILRDFTSLVSTLLTFLNYLLYPMVMVAGALMDNEMLIGPAMEDKLLAIWVEIRNWVNMFFVLLLVGIALYNVLGIAGDGSNYALKSILPKIVIGLVAVNFSFLAGKLLIDSTAVLTNAVYALPSGANLVDWDEERTEMRLRLCRIPKTGANNMTLPLVDENGNPIDDNVNPRAKKNGSVLASLFCEGEPDGDNLTGEFTEFGQSFFSNFGSHNIAVTLMVQMGNVSGLNTPDEAGLQSLSQITFQMLFNIIIFVMFGFAYAALIVVLVARVIVLWIVLALSPVVILLFVLPDLASFAGGEFDLRKQFFQHLFAPLIIGVVLSIGFTMLNTLQENGGGSWLGRIGEIDLGQLQDTTQVDQLASTYGTELSNFQSLLVAIGAVLVIWMGVFGAAKQTVASGIVETIKGAGQKFGKFMGTLPMYATVIPAHKGGGEGMSLGTMLGAAMQGPQRFESKQRQRENDLGDKLFGGRSGIEKDRDRVRGSISTGTPGDAQKAFYDHLKFKESWSSPEEVKKLAVEIARKNGNEPLAKEIEKKSASDVAAGLKGGSYNNLFGGLRNVNPGEWNHDTIGTDESASATPAASVAPAVTAATTALKGVTGPLSGNAAALAAVGKALSDDNVQDDVNLTALFSNPNEAGLKGNNGAIAQFEGIKGADAAGATQILGTVTKKDGKVDAAGFVQAVSSYQAPTPVAGTTAVPTTPAAGAAAGTAPAATPAAPAGAAPATP